MIKRKFLNISHFSLIFLYFSGGSFVKFSHIVEWWQEIDSNSGSRLIIVLDTELSHKWVKEVRRIKTQYIALQTCYFRPNTTPSSRDDSDDLESGTQGRFQVGSFTNEWMDYNGARINDVDFHDSKRRLKAIYAVSRNWSDFTFHLPTDQDIIQHWKANFPKFTRPLAAATKINCCDACCCITCVVRCIKRKRMRWAPPSELDTRHGFRLVTS